jgi:tripartite-type tricarboxylate transporter receptor subunit TctC
MMKLPRRTFLHLAAGAAVSPTFSRSAGAQSYPARPVRVIVGFPAGGPTDITARLIGQWLSERLGQQFVIDNRPGAGSNIAVETAVRAPPDGYTLLIVGATNAVNATLYDKLNFNFIRDIAPVAGIIRVPLIMEVHPSVPAQTVPEFIAFAKANPGKINMASGGNGTTLHVSGELFKMMTDVNMIHVPYRGAGPMLIDLPKSVPGHSRRFKREVAMTASPQGTDISSGDRLVRVVPTTDVGPIIRSPRRRSRAHRAEL